jgi:hypothetical protein
MKKKLVGIINVDFIGQLKRHRNEEVTLKQNNHFRKTVGITLGNELRSIVQKFSNYVEAI